MLQAKKWGRMAVALPALDPAPRAAVVFPLGRVAVGLVVLLCLSLRMASTGLLVASVRHEGGRVVACRYFAGTHVVERQHVVAANGADRHVSCPLIEVR